MASKLAHYFTGRYVADRAGVVGIAAYALALVASAAYLHTRLPLWATVVFSFAAATAAEHCARWFAPRD